MKKIIAILFSLLIIADKAVTQNNIPENKKPKLTITGNDTSRILALLDLTDHYKVIKPDSALIYGYEALELAGRINFAPGEVHALESMIITQSALGNYSKAFQLSFRAKKIAEKNNLTYEKAMVFLEESGLYRDSKDYAKAMTLARDSKKIFDSVKDSYFSAFSQLVIGSIYLAEKKLDSALYRVQLSHDSAIQIKNNWVIQYTLASLGKVYKESGNTDKALSYFRQTLSATFDDEELNCDSYLSIGKIYQQINKTDSAILNGKRSFDLALQRGLFLDIINASIFLSDVYEKKDTKQSLYYSKTAITYKDSLSSMSQSSTQETFINFDEHERQQEIENAKMELNNRLRVGVFLGITFILLVLAIFLFRSSRLKHRSKQKVERAYDELKSTQAQLIQSEKMASLGELTTGIAHEIQNPLNFVNNFSEVNKEMMIELIQEIDKGNYDDVKNIANDLIANEIKIIQHGKRADAIVKGMLQHSRQTSGKHEPTDINALCEQYFRVSYNGIRDKDESFKAAFKTDFDLNIGKINIVPQEIGRILLNLFNNALYAVNEKRKTASDAYEPLITVQTKTVRNKIEITIGDNGIGIPSGVIDKIFQPFFTTKPTGLGTGLGLSLAYETITKKYGGTIKAESIQGEGSRFIIQLSIA